MARMHRQLRCSIRPCGRTRRCRRSRAADRRPACRGSWRASRGPRCPCARRCRTGSPRRDRRRPSPRARGRDAGAAIVMRMDGKDDRARAARDADASTRSGRRRRSASRLSTVAGRLMMHSAARVGCQTSMTRSTTPRAQNRARSSLNVSGEYSKRQSVAGCCAAQLREKPRACRVAMLDDARRRSMPYTTRRNSGAVGL